MRKLLALVIALVAFPAIGGVNTIVSQHSLVACGAGANHSSSDGADSCAAGAKLDLGLPHFASFQVVWSGLTGTINGTVKVQASNDGTDWSDKASATVTLSGAAGNTIISLNDSAAEEFYQAVYTHSGITGGTIDVYSIGK